MSKFITMRYLIHINIILIQLFALNTSAQTEVNKDSLSVLKSAIFNGGNKYLDFHEFIIKNIVYPETAINDIIDDKVFVQFCIDTVGLIKDIKIIKSLRNDLDNAVINAVKLSPSWTPATINGNPVSQCFTYPVHFKNDKKTIKHYMKKEDKKD